MRSTLKNIARSLYDIRGWRTNRKIVVIESDDWGAIRMPNKKVRDRLLSKYPQYFNSPYYRYDTLANQDDLTALFEVLESVKDKNGKHPIITANSIMANPDFEKIQRDSFQKYHYEKFTTTLENYYPSNVFSLWKEGMQRAVFFPQLHGREHVDVERWMKVLKDGNEVYHDIFSKNMYAVDYDYSSSKKNLTAALDCASEEEAYQKAEFVGNGCDIFKNTFGFYSKSFIAPSYTWNEKIENKLIEYEVEYLQGIRIQKVPTHEQATYQYTKHFLGEKNDKGQVYLIRNVFFEPSLSTTSMDVSLQEAMTRIKWSFRFGLPVIISSHRLNFIGAIDESNRTKNLDALGRLLNNMMQQWPDIEFMTTPQLGELIKPKK